MMITSFLASDPATSWLIVGAGLIFLEILVAGVGLLFAGFAAILVGLLVNYSIISTDDFIMQLGAFFALTTFIAAILWKKLKSWRINPDNKDSFSNMVGNSAIVATDFNKGDIGKVKWSGTIMNAEIHKSSDKDSFSKNDVVEIKEVDGNTLFIIPRD